MVLTIPFGGLLPAVTLHGGTVKTVPYAATLLPSAAATKDLLPGGEAGLFDV